MNYTKELSIITILIIILTIITPTILAHEFQEQIEDNRNDPGPILTVEAGGPYETTPGNIIFFDGYFTIYNNSLNVTGYRWNFGDQNSYEYFYPQPISNISENNRCLASHIYGYGNFQAVLIIYIEQNSSIQSRIDGKIFNNQQLLIQNTDIAQVSVVYDPWDEQTNPNNYFKKYVWDDELGWSETTTHNIGDTIRFRINYTATNSIDDVVIKDFLPATVRYTNANPPPSSMSQNVYFNNEKIGYCPTTKLIWDIGEMYSGEQIYIEIYGIVEYLDKSYFGIIDNSYPIIYTTNNLAKLNGRRHSAGCGNPYSVIYTANADFIITCENPDIDIKKYVKEKGANEFEDYGIIADIGDDVVFKLVVTNIGDVPLRNVWVCDVLPMGLVYNDSASLGEPDDVQDNVYCWDIGNLVSGQSVVITFEAFAEECGEYRNVANVSGRYNQQRLSDEDDTNIKVECKPDFAIRKYVLSDYVIGEHITIKIGDIVHFIIEVENIGDVPLENVEIRDELPSELAFLSAFTVPDSVVGQVITWYVDLDVGEVKIFYLNITVVGPVNPCDEVTVVNWIYGILPTGLSRQDDANVTIVNPCEPGVKIKKYVKEKGASVFNDFSVSVDVGDDVVFKLVVTNIGDVPLENVWVCDVLPMGLVYNDSASPGEPDDVQDNVYCWDIGTLVSGQSVVITFEAFAEECGEFLNNASVFALYDQQELIDDDNASVVVFCEPEPGLIIEKAVKYNCNGTLNDVGITVPYGMWVTFRIEVINTGDVPLDLTICDELPMGMLYLNHAYVNGDLTPPTSSSGNIFCWYIGIVDPGDIVVIKFRAEGENCETYINNATAIGTYHQEIYSVWDTAYVIVECVEEWDHSNLIVSGECIYDNTTFTITNTEEPGGGDMNGTTEYRVYRNGILEDTQSFQLNGGESLIISVPGECDIIRLEVDQRPDHPGASQIQSTVEGCGCTEKNEEGEISKSKEQTLETRFILRSIRELIDSFKDKGLINILSNIRLRLREVLQDIICKINSR